MILLQFGKRERLESLKQGKIYFSSIKSFRAIEKEQMNKGQGDINDGKFVVKADNVQYFHPVIGQLLFTLNNIEIPIDFDGNENYPAICFAKTETNEQKQIIYSLLDLEKIIEQFPTHDAILVVFDVEKFIERLREYFGEALVAEEIKYYDKNRITTDIVHYLTSTVTTENKYKTAFVKDVFFKDQREFRCILKDGYNCDQVYDLNGDLDFAEILSIEEFKKTII